MLRKIIIATIFLLLLSSSLLVAAQPTVEGIQNLISQGKTDEALNFLNKSDLSSDPDLKFYRALLLSWEEEYDQAEEILLELTTANPGRLDSYNQLARIYGWKRQFIKAEEVIGKAQKISYSSERTALLAKHQEWQGNYFEAKKLIKKAVAKAETSELEAKYKESLNRIEKELKAVLYLEGRVVYSEADREDLELAFGIEKMLRDGINLDTVAATNYFKEESNFVFRSEIEIDKPLIPEKTSFSSGLVFYNGDSRDKYELNNNFDYFIGKKNVLGLNFNFVKDNINTDYQNLELEYEHRFKKTVMVLKNSSRRDDSGWTPDFSQHVDFYYPKDNYLLNLELSHYKGGDYVFKIGFQFSDLFSGDKFNLSSLNLWLNQIRPDKNKTANLDFRINLK